MKVLTGERDKLNKMYEEVRYKRYRTLVYPLDLVYPKNLDPSYKMALIFGVVLGEKLRLK